MDFPPKTYKSENIFTVQLVSEIYPYIKVCYRARYFLQIPNNIATAKRSPAILTPPRMVLTASSLLETPHSKVHTAAPISVQYSACCRSCCLASCRCCRRSSFSWNRTRKFWLHFLSAQVFRLQDRTRNIIKAIYERGGGNSQQLQMQTFSPELYLSRVSIM